MSRTACSDDSPFDRFAQDMIAHHNEICIACDTRIVRLVGVMRDISDIYYIVRSTTPAPDGRRQFAISAVGAIVPLKACYPADAYARSDNILSLNGAGPSETFFIIDQTRGDQLPEA